MSNRSSKLTLLIAAVLAFAAFVCYYLVSRTSGPKQTSLSSTSTSMLSNSTLAKQREAAGLAAIRKAFGTPDDEHGATLFVSHHLAEVDADYWRKHLGSDKPEPARVLDILVLRDSWGGDDELQTYDFTLPDDATNYVISVRFSDAGDIEEISMES